MEYDLTFALIKYMDKPFSHELLIDLQKRLETQNEKGFPFTAIDVLKERLKLCRSTFMCDDALDLNQKIGKLFLNSND